ncbi:hypothetical protein K435DRAFT_755853 [Dendrothele bispora CBS 962.96]|uniref:R3H-associated N-terminal domain-containing protein n=1 Tax=Dendrothele bispora (strain CBS 962.96) TaxID=1314807 RepID=A0A4S8M177_DENBC|nr:hypothetical protein K435DRAFT_755853 [Dendrothele bispora CBS 962.96]
MGDQPTETHSNLSEQPAQNPALDNPIPLSFPAILRNPGVPSRYAHLQELKTKANAPSQKTRKSRVNDNEGRRWVRRKENAQFVDNPHIVSATKKDYVVPPVAVKSTFPEPLPVYLSRNTKIASTVVPGRDQSTANAGRFSLSLKGMRRDLRRSGFRAQVLVRDVEAEILDWLERGGTVMGPDINNTNTISDDLLASSGRTVGETQTIYELSRTPLQLVWRVPDDAFARYVIHCCARFHGVISFSKELSGIRLTHLLRPNVARPDSFAMSTLDTPPATDLDDSSHFASDSDFMSERDNLSEIVDSDAEGPHLSSQDSHQLSAIPESRSASPAVSAIEEWSVIGEDSDVDGDEAEADESLAQSFASSVSLNEATPRARLASRNVRMIRSASSPSRSPARRQMHPQFGRRSFPRVSSKLTLYQFVYS